MNKGHNTEISNVLVIGSGGAGLRAAIETKKHGLDVVVLGKRCKTDSHTVLAAGGINASFGNLDKEDSWEHHFADTYTEGYGLGNPEIIEIMAKDAKKAVTEIDNWGANFQKLKNGNLDQRYFGAHTFRRTCFSGDYTGQSILNTLLKKSYEYNIPIFDKQYVTDLLIKEGICFGALSFNIFSGERTVHLADAVILCTGGHTRIWKKSSSRKLENNGDGFHLALKAGCELIDMEMVQFHPTGILWPEEYAGTLVTEAVRGEGGKLFNVKGERFMEKYDQDRMELSSRDRVALANYREIIEGRGTSRGGVYLDISHKSKDFIINKIPKIYRQFLELQMNDISKEKMEVAPTAHYTMGGILLSPEDHDSPIQGLYAAGEVAGGLHGANRLGGNSLAEILIFGRRAGKAAANYSKKLKFQQRSEQSISFAHENLDILIKKGKELSLPLKYELQEIMWNFCGVLKDEKKLITGLGYLNLLEEKINDVDVRLSENNYQDLVNICDLKSSLICAKATIISSIERKESRGAHQRSDFQQTDPNFSCNFKIKYQNGSLKISRKETISLKRELENYVKNNSQINNFKGRLLE
tara:strand:+ start:1504 stop:3252 length:1749 start_codon:yes stop_codon:yes gene_type:complete